MHYGRMGCFSFTCECLGAVLSQNLTFTQKKYPLLMADSSIREAVAEIATSSALDAATRKILAQFLRDYDSAMADNQKLRTSLLSQKKECKHHEEYIDSLKHALSIRVHDFGFDSEAGVDGLMLIGTLKKNLKQEVDAHQDLLEVNKGLEERLASCKQTLSELLKSSQAAAKKLKQAHEKLDLYDAKLNIWASDLATDADIEKITAKVRESHELREAVEDISLELNIIPEQPISKLKNDLMKTITAMKLAMQIMDNELEQTKAENQDMTAIQEQLTNTVAEQEQIIEASRPSHDSSYAEEKARLELIIEDLRKEISRLQVANEQVSGQLKEAEILLQRQTISSVAGRDSFAAENATDALINHSTKSASSCSYGLEVTGSVVNTLASESAPAACAMKLSDLQPRQEEDQSSRLLQSEVREFAGQIDALIQENNYLREDKRELERQVDDLRQIIEHKDMSIQLLNVKEANSKSQLDDLILENVHLTEEVQRIKQTSAAPPASVVDELLKDEVADLRTQISLLDRRLRESEARNSTLLSAVSGYEDVLQQSLNTVEKLAKGAAHDLNQELAHTNKSSSVLPQTLSQTPVEEPHLLSITDIASTKLSAINAAPTGDDGLVVNYELGPGDQIDLQATETGHKLSGVIGGNHICITTAPLHSSTKDSSLVHSKHVCASIAESTGDDSRGQSIKMTVEKIISTYRQFGIDLPTSMMELEAELGL